MIVCMLVLEEGSSNRGNCGNVNVQAVLTLTMVPNKLSNVSCLLLVFTFYNFCIATKAPKREAHFSNECCQ